MKLAIFRFRRGPIFTNVLLADEINRTPPRTQSALLEAMSEAGVTVEGRTIGLEQPFFVVATQNPYSFEGTYPLPENQLDRFRCAFGWVIWCPLRVELSSASPFLRRTRRAETRHDWRRPDRSSTPRR